MRFRLALVFSVLAALAIVSGAPGADGAKYKVRVNSITIICYQPCDTNSIVITRLDNDRTSCRPLVETCKWTARAGTKIVLELSASPEFTVFSWGGDCSSTGPKCTLVVDSNKFLAFFASTTPP